MTEINLISICCPRSQIAGDKILFNSASKEILLFLHMTQPPFFWSSHVSLICLTCQDIVCRLLGTDTERHVSVNNGWFLPQYQEAIRDFSA